MVLAREMFTECSMTFQISVSIKNVSKDILKYLHVVSI